MCAIVAPFSDTVLAVLYFKLSTASVMLAGTSARITFFFGSYLLT